MASLSSASRVRGIISLDGQPRKRWMSRMVAYVPQFDFLLPTLTVRETLRYSAQLRLPRSTTQAQVEVRHPQQPIRAITFSLALRLRIRSFDLQSIRCSGWSSGWEKGPLAH